MPMHSDTCPMCGAESQNGLDPELYPDLQGAFCAECAGSMEMDSGEDVDADYEDDDEDDDGDW